jgi:hypothetical protein
MLIQLIKEPDAFYMSTDGHKVKVEYDKDGKSANMPTDVEDTHYIAYAYAQYYLYVEAQREAKKNKLKNIIMSTTI